MNADAIVDNLFGGIQAVPVKFLFSLYGMWRWSVGVTELLGETNLDDIDLVIALSDSHQKVGFCLA